MSRLSIPIVSTLIFALLCTARIDAQSLLSRRLESIQLMQEGRYSEAEEILKTLVAKAPSATNTYLLGTCLLRRYRHSQALPFLEAATNANPRNHQWLNTLAECHLEMGHCERSMTVLDRAIAIAPLSVYRYNKAMCALNLGELELAEVELRLAVESDQVSAATLTKLGGLLAGQGRDAEAETLLSRSIDLDDSQIEAFFILGQVDNRLDRPDRAVRRFQHVLDRYPTHAGALYNLGRTLVAMGRTAEGAVVLERFAALEPAEEMVQNYRDYLATVPSALPERLHLAEQLLNLGRFTEALQEIEIAQRLDPESAATFALMARVQAAAGNRIEADRAASRAEALQPDHP